MIQKQFTSLLGFLKIDHGVTLFAPAVIKIEMLRGQTFQNFVLVHID